MNAGINVCGLPGCFAPLPDGNTIACPSVSRHQQETSTEPNTTSATAHLQYNAARHIGLCGERSNLRMRSRAAELFRMVYNCTMMNLWPAQFEIQGHTAAPGDHLVTISSRIGPRSGRPWRQGNMDLRDAFATMSFNMCVFAVNLSFLPACWLFHGRAVALRIWEAFPIVARQTFVGFQNQAWQPVTQLHSFFTISRTTGPWPPTDALTVDLSAWQYGHTVSAQLSAAHVRTRVAPGHTNPYNFARFFKRHHRRLRDPRLSVRDKKHEMLLEIAIRIVCNVLYYHVARLRPNGINGLLTMRHDSFVRTLDTIGRALYNELDALQGDIDHVLLSNNHLPTCWNHIEELDGPGYRAMMAAYNLRRNAGGC